jgi:uncharacterized protein
LIALNNRSERYCNDDTAIAILKPGHCAPHFAGMWSRLSGDMIPIGNIRHQRVMGCTAVNVLMVPSQPQRTVKATSSADTRLNDWAAHAAATEERNMADQKHSGNTGNFSDDREKAAESGRKGGQHSGGNHTGGQHGSGNLADDHEKAAEAGRKGGQHSSGSSHGEHGDIGHKTQGGTHEQHVKAGQQSHKNS